MTASVLKQDYKIKCVCVCLCVCVCVCVCVCGGGGGGRTFQPGNFTGWGCEGVKEQHTTVPCCCCRSVQEVPGLPATGTDL